MRNRQTPEFEIFVLMPPLSTASGSQLCIFFVFAVRSTRQRLRSQSRPSVQVGFRRKAVPQIAPKSQFGRGFNWAHRRKAPLAAQDYGTGSIIRIASLDRTKSVAHIVSPLVQPVRAWRIQND